MEGTNGVLKLVGVTTVSSCCLSLLMLLGLLAVYALLLLGGNYCFFSVIV